MYIYIDSFSGIILMYVFSLQPHVPINYESVYFNNFRTSRHDFFNFSPLILLQLSTSNQISLYMFLNIPY